jgi:HEPN domain-containing protein
VPKGRKTVPTSRAEAPLYLSKAEQFAAEARAALEGSRFDAALLNAVHATITACDAVTVGLAGVRSADPDHQRAVDLLKEIVPPGGSAGSHVRQARLLLAKKNLVEYESRRATGREAAEAVARAERILEWSREVVTRARL